MAQHQEKKSYDKKKDGDIPPAEANPEVVKKGKDIKGNIDELLDKIDNVLEKNAKEFVENYIQKGGE